MTQTLSKMISQHPDSAPALGGTGADWLSYGALRKLSAEIGKQLHSSGLGRTDRVAIVLPNGSEMAAAFITLAQWVVTAPLNPNYTKDEFTEKVMEITNNEGVPAVFDGVGKNTFYGSLACLKTRGMMVSFGNASGPLDPVDVPKDIQPKGLYLTRPSIGQYFTNREELQAGADSVFEKVKFGKIKIKIYKEYNLADAKQAHDDLESRKLTGPAILIP